MEPTVPDALGALMAVAVEEYGADVVLKTWKLFCAPFLPVTVVVLRASALHELATAHGLTDPSMVEDAMALLGNLRASNDPHDAWLASVLWNKHCQNRMHFLACAEQTYKAPDDGQSNPTMPGLSGGGTAHETDPTKLDD